jgi:hypothetical protein
MKTHCFITIFLFLMLFVFAACDHGLGPTTEITGMAGSISYLNWPTPDSLLDLRLVVFKNYPPENILLTVLTDTAFVYPGLEVPAPGLPLCVDMTAFEMKIDPGTYDYVVVAQRFGPEVTADWQAVGQYDTTLSDSLPTSITITRGELLKEINIVVDFHQLPPQPF